MENYMWLLILLFVFTLLITNYFTRKFSLSGVESEKKNWEEKIHQLTLQYQALKEEKSAEMEKWRTEFQQKEQIWNNERKEWQAHNTQLQLELTQKETEIRYLNQKIIEDQKQIDDLNQKFQKEFENLANKILEEKSEKFSQQNKNQIEHLLHPLKEKLTTFEKKVEDTHKENLLHQHALKQQIIGLQELNQAMSKEAQNLSNALKKDTKLQGSWGELILEKVLEKSGLEKGREYVTQKAFQTEEGRKLPDVIINLPDGKKLIIDSKVSLNAYNEFVNQTEEEAQNQFLKLHLQALKNHVQTLSEKNYHQLYEMESPDFVLMFVPIETAFSAALNAEPQLYNHAFDKNIVIVTPSTLLATLKTIDTMWQNEKQKQNTLEISKQAANLYDKFVGLLEDLEKVGNQMRTVTNTYETTMRKLTGSGNLIRRVEKLKKLGVKASKQIDQKWIEKENDV